MEPPAESSLLILATINTTHILSLLSVFILLFFSALVSASEVAYFSLTPTQLEQMRQQKIASDLRVLHILEKPKRLLATILIANNMINVAIVIIAATTINQIVEFNQENEWLKFTLEVLAVTFIILLFGEVLPKIYASRNALPVARLMVNYIFFLRAIFLPVSKLMINGTKFMDKKIEKNKKQITVDELEKALELTYADGKNSEEKKILEGIVKFGHTDAKQIMKPRTDMVAFEINTPYLNLIAHIIDSGFSRIPVYEESLDNIKGVLYIKDLLPYLNEDNNFDWKKLIRPAFFVPENKKIDDLLKEFKDSKVHLAIVVDEYGGTLGIVTLEDVIEEIVGEITDEFDDEKITYTKIDNNNYVFEGKTALIDVYKVLQIDGREFEDNKGDSDTLGGFILEIAKRLPLVNEKITFKNYTFTIEAADKRKIKQVKISIHNEV